MLKLRKVELLGFKSFCEKTHIVFSGSGVTCIIGPNGCGKSNVVDAISWVLGEQSHKMLRAERMSDCIFNGTAKRLPLGFAEVSLTLVDPELADAVAKVTGESLDAAASEVPSAGIAPSEAGLAASESPEDAAAPEENSSSSAGALTRKLRKRGAGKSAIQLKPGEVVVGRRLYRSGQSEYLLNGRVARLRDVQELFMTMGLGPDSYAIIEQGRIGQILSSRPMDRRALIEEAAGITVYKTKRRLAETKLEAAKVNLSRVNDILVEVDKQLAALKRQASKARRYAEIREEMRGVMRTVLASRARQLDGDAERLEKAIAELTSAENQQASTLHELEVEQERLAARTYGMETELRHVQNLLNQSALELDRAENRTLFHQEQIAQTKGRVAQIETEIAQLEEQARQIETRLDAHRISASGLRADSLRLESELQDLARELAASSIEENTLQQKIEQLRDSAARSGEDSVRVQVELLQAEDQLSKLAETRRQHREMSVQLESGFAAAAEQAQAAETRHHESEQQAVRCLEKLQAAQESLIESKALQAQAARRNERLREQLSAARARRTSLEQILNDRAYSVEAVQKLFSANASESANGFRAVGVLADYAEVEQEYEGAIEQFLRDELEYVVVETFDHARAGIALLRDKMGGRATFFVDSLRSLPYAPKPDDVPSFAPGLISRLDRLVEFRAPLGPAAKQFLSKLQGAYLMSTAAEAEELARKHTEQYFVTLDGTCYHGRAVTGGRPGEAGPLALKRELRMHEAEAARLENLTAETESELASLAEQQKRMEQELEERQAARVETEKLRTSAFHQLEQAREETARVEKQLSEARAEDSRLDAEAQSAQSRAEEMQRASEKAIHSRTTAEEEASSAVARLSEIRAHGQSQQAELSARREALAAISERVAGAQEIEMRLAGEANQINERLAETQNQHRSLLEEVSERESSVAQLTSEAGNFRQEKEQLTARQSALEEQWNALRERAGNLDDELRTSRLALEELRVARSQREIEKARNDSDREHLRQTCMEDANAQPEELIAQQENFLGGEELVAAENSYVAAKARLEAFGAVNMMALEEFQECEQRNSFLTRERDDLVESIQNTQQAIAELDAVSRQKFEEAFNIINRNFSEAFHTVFGGGSGEMRLTEADSSGECGIDIVAQPPGKRLQNILLLSGGEKAMTALALLIAVFRFQPSPFCILDEVDAPLDEANVGRFNRMLREMGEQTQFIIITHNRKTMEMGSVLYGVTMQEPGVSKLVSVRWEEQAEAKAKSTAA